MVTKTTPHLRRASTSVVDVHLGPSLAYERLAEIADNALYKVLGKYHTGQLGDIGTWWQIEHTDSRTGSGWVRGDYVTLHNVDDMSPTWQPYTATLRTGSLALPSASGTVFPITSLFDDPRRGPMGWDPEQRNLPIHRGIDWAMAGPVYAMAAGRVTNIVTGQPEKDKNAGYGNRVTVQSDHGFRITYAHLAEVEQGLVNEYYNTPNVELRRLTQKGEPAQNESD